MEINSYFVHIPINKKLGSYYKDLCIKQDTIGKLYPTKQQVFTSKNISQLQLQLSYKACYKATY